MAWWIVLALASDYDELVADDGWQPLDVVEAGIAGPVQLDVKHLGTPCLRAQIDVEVPADALFEVVTDVPAAPSITREHLLASEILDEDGPRVDYYQHLDVPNWTLTADRYWVLRGERVQRPEGPMFRWTRFDWEGDYPELAERVSSEHPDALEPSVNWGAWTFEEHGERTRAAYHMCSNAGGGLPRWLKRIVATRALPNTVEDVVEAAHARLQAMNPICD